MRSLLKKDIIEYKMTTFGGNDMGISIEDFLSRGGNLDGVEELSKKGKKGKGGRPKWEPTEEEIEEVRKNGYKRKNAGRCWNCVFWCWRFGDTSGTIKGCPVRGIKVAGFCGCKGYFRTRL